jgi:hypothetical protein
MRLCSAIMDDRRSRNSLRMLACALFAGSLLLATCGCQTIPALSHRAVLTPAEQSGLGAVAVSELLGTSKLSQDQQQLSVTGAVGERLVTASGRSDLDWDFKIVSHPRPFAVALPDGTVLVTDAQLARCRSEAELAAVLAKEMGCMLAGVYPREVRSPNTGAAYVPLNIGELTPADLSAEKAEDLQAADSIGLSMLVRAGYDPNAATKVWLASAETGRPDGKTTRINSRRRNELRQQSFGRSLAEAQAVYQHHSAKIGSGGALAFVPSQQAAQPSNQTALEWVSPQALTAPPVTKAAAAVPATPTLPGSNNVVVSSDGEFLPPTVASTRPGASNWAAAPSAPEPSVIEQTSYEQPEGPSFGPSLP